MKNLAVLCTVFAFLCPTAHAAEAPTREALARALGTSLLGNALPDDLNVNTTLTGPDGCSVEIKLSADGFVISGSGQGKSVMLQPMRPTSMKVENEGNREAITFETSGPCLGGFSPGSSSCDKNLNKMVVHRNAAGEIYGIELAHRVMKFMQFTTVVTCQLK